ncbi:MAG: tRNA uridine-5-carboxymethylaminomethyl(34) synthesis GTPase MnmE [Clostridia bacterium]|nr:tRNA uridine-5-carboxymethylaminomethyl(34) synthesis GTPase MnmE [Clostridia bacterium]
MSDTICAIATAVGNGGVAVIRISGEKAKEIGESVFEKLHNAKPRYATFGKLKFDGVVDDALAIYFPAPRSFTGEDVVELQIHGGYYLAQSLVKALIVRGARLAERGEFSKRAVLNGQMDMSQAEGIIDLINANSLSQLKAGSGLLSGAMKEYVLTMQDELTELMCELNVALDYPEHDIEYITAQKIAQKITEIIQKIDKKLATANTGLQVKNGVNVVLAGKPNAGKSSLLNALLGYERAIVTDIAGTTRDTVSESFEYNGVRFNLIDTAGLRQTEDCVESAGIERAKNEINHADIVLEIIDASAGDNGELNGKNVLKIANKSDLGGNIECDLQISAKTGKNIEKLKEMIFNHTIDKNILLDGDFLTNTRHIECLISAKEALIDTLNNANNATLDCLAVTIMQAWNKLGEITGDCASEKIINEIFAKFCLGK